MSMPPAISTSSETQAILAHCHVKQPLRETVGWHRSQTSDLPPVDATYPSARFLNVTTPSRAIVFYGAANRDPRVGEPGILRLYRRGTRHPAVRRGGRP